MKRDRRSEPFRRMVVFRESHTAGASATRRERPAGRNTSANLREGHGNRYYGYQEGDIHVHDLGHRIIANRIFEVLAANCSCIAQKALEDRRRAGKSPWRYGLEGRENALVRDFYPDSTELLKPKQ